GEAGVVEVVAVRQGFDGRAEPSVLGEHGADGRGAIGHRTSLSSGVREVLRAAGESPLSTATNTAEARPRSWVMLREEPTTPSDHARRAMSPSRATWGTPPPPLRISMSRKST